MKLGEYEHLTSTHTHTPHMGVVGNEYPSQNTQTERSCKVQRVSALALPTRPFFVCLQLQYLPCASTLPAETRFISLSSRDPSDQIHHLVLHLFEHLACPLSFFTRCLLCDQFPFITVAHIWCTGRAATGHHLFLPRAHSWFPACIDIDSSTRSESVVIVPIVSPPQGGFSLVHSRSVATFHPVTLLGIL